MSRENDTEYKPIPMDQLPSGLTPEYLIMRAWDGDRIPVHGVKIMSVDREGVFASPHEEIQIVTDTIVRGKLPIFDRGNMRLPQICLYNDISYRLILTNTAVLLARSGYSDIGKLLLSSTSYDYPQIFLEKHAIMTCVEYLPPYDSRTLSQLEDSTFANWIRDQLPEQVMKEIHQEEDRRLRTDEHLNLMTFQKEIILEHPCVQEQKKKHKIISCEFKAGSILDPEILKAYMSGDQFDALIAELLPLQTHELTREELFEMVDRLCKTIPLPLHQLHAIMQMVLRGVSSRHLKLFPYFDAQQEFTGPGLVHNISLVKENIMKEVMKIEDIRLYSITIFPLLSED